MTVMLQAEALSKRFTLHLQGGMTLPVLDGAGFTVSAGTSDSCTSVGFSLTVVPSGQIGRAHV